MAEVVSESHSPRNSEKQVSPTISTAPQSAASEETPAASVEERKDEQERSASDHLTDGVVLHDVVDSCCKEFSIYELLRTDILKCPVCNETYKYPCLLPCLHSVCGNCIDEHRTEYTSTEGNSDAESDLVFTCEVCDTSHTVPIGGFVSNHFLLNLIEIHQVQTDDDIVCTYCQQYESLEKTASGRCLECGDNLCDGCTTAHKKTKLTRTHRIAPFDQIKLGKYDAEIRQMQAVSCNTHPTQSSDRYCVTCNRLVCSECTSCDRHDAIALSECTSGPGELVTEDSVRELREMLAERVAMSKDHLEEMTTRKSQLDQSVQDVTHTINSRAKFLHDLIDRRQAELTERITSKYLDTSDRAQKERKSVLQTAVGYSKNAVFLDALTQFGNKEEKLDLDPYIHAYCKRIRKTELELGSDRLSVSVQDTVIDEDCQLAVEAMMGKLVITQEPKYSLEFTPDTPQQSGTNSERSKDQQYSVCSTRSKLRSTYVPSLLPRPELCLTFDSHLSADKNNTWPTGVCTVPSSGDIVVCDRDNALIKIFSANGNFKMAIEGEQQYALIKPFDVACLSNDEIVVSDYGCEAVKIFSNITGIGRLIISGEFEYPRGVAVTRDDLILVLDSELGRITIHSPTDGRLLKTVAGVNVANNLIDPYYICTTRYDDDILVTDFAEPNIKTVSINGEDNSQTSGEYGTVSKPQGLLQPYGCCQDHFGITFIADNRNDKISLMLPDGRLEKHIITRVDGLWQPIAVCLDGAGRLVVTEGLGQIKVFKYLE